MWRCCSTRASSLQHGHCGASYLLPQAWLICLGLCLTKSRIENRKGIERGAVFVIIITYSPSFPFFFLCYVCFCNLTSSQLLVTTFIWKIKKDPQFRDVNSLTSLLGFYHLFILNSLCSFVFWCLSQVGGRGLSLD